MKKKIIFTIVGLALLLTGIVVAVPILADLASYLKANFTIEGWGKDKSFNTRLVLSGISTVLGLMVLIVGLKLKRLVFNLIIFAVIILVAVVSSVYAYKYVVNNNANKDKEIALVFDAKTGIEINIPLGSNTTSIANLLMEKGLIKYPVVFKALSKINGYDGAYKSGVHYVATGLDYDKIMRILASNPATTKVTIPEGFSYTQIRERFISKNLVTRDKFDKAANTEKYDFKFLNDLPKRDVKLEGYLFPDTYEFGLGVGEKEIIKALLSNFNKKFSPEDYETAKKLNMTVDQIIILASIIEREAKDEEDRKIISGVFYNRLKSKDKSLRKLQSCATIQYILLNTQGVVKEKLTEKDTQIPDPYNTYVIEGLPPGPICSPGKASIDAALNPQKTDYLFFAAKGDGTGTHQFSKTLKEHQAAIKKYGLNITVR